MTICPSLLPTAKQLRGMEIIIYDFTIYSDQKIHFFFFALILSN